MCANNEIHTFAVCAYEESPYLEECLASVMNQKMKSKVIITTSTPNDYIRGLAEKYNVPLIVNPKYKVGVIEDWNFAYHSASTQFITICHQDDVYYSDYSKYFYNQCATSPNMLIFFSDYCEIRNGEKLDRSKLLCIKRFLLCPLKIKPLQKCKFIRRIILSFGSSICCPAVTFNKDNLDEPIFKHEFSCLCDWAAWEEISRKSGEFIYCSRIMVGHRIHDVSWTSQVIKDKTRELEELRMFQKFWPKPIAKLLELFYKKSTKSNEL